MNRDAFLYQVRRATESGRAYRVHTKDVPPETGYVGSAQPDWCQAIAAEVDAVGGVAHLVDDFASARATVRNLLTKYQARSALCWQHPLLDRVGVAELLRSQNVEALDSRAMSLDPPARQRERAFAADVGITSVDWAIAETGSLVLRARPGQERIASLLPPVHIALIGASQIVADLCDVFARLQEQGLKNLPSHVTLVTGPSKTGDIELQLTTGVHGPGHWHVVVIRNES